MSNPRTNRPGRPSVQLFQSHLSLLRKHLLHLLRPREVVPDARAFDRRRSLQLEPSVPLRPPEVVVRRVPRPEVNYRYFGAPRFYCQRAVFPQDADSLDLPGWKSKQKKIQYGLGLMPMRGRSATVGLFILALG